MNTPKKQYANEVLNTIAARRSIRMFTDQPVSDEHLNAVLTSANQAPSAHNQQSWKFIVLEGAMKESLASLVNTRSGEFPRPSSVLLRMAARSIASAPLVVAVVNTGKMVRHGTDLFKINKEIAHDFFRVMEIQSSAAAVQNLLLAAASLGLATVWLGILILVQDDVLQLLGEPKGEFMAVIPVGYAAVRPASGPHKQPLEQIVRRLK